MTHLIKEKGLDDAMGKLIGVKLRIAKDVRRPAGSTRTGI
jgi:hypothetical protein